LKRGSPLDPVGDWVEVDWNTSRQTVIHTAPAQTFRPSVILPGRRLANVARQGLPETHRGLLADLGRHLVHRLVPAQSGHDPHRWPVLAAHAERADTGHSPQMRKPTARSDEADIQSVMKSRIVQHRRKAALITNRSRRTGANPLRQRCNSRGGLIKKPASAPTMI